FQELVATTGSPVRARVALERIIQGNDLDNVNYLAKGLAASRPVCRIQLRDSSGQVIGFGTGFLIGPLVLMTNHHVFGQASDARPSIAESAYEIDVRGSERISVPFELDPDTLFHSNLELDFAIVAVRPRSQDGTRDLRDWQWLPLSGERGK